MKRLFLVLGTSILVLPWLTGARVQANPIYFDFSSQLSSVPNSVAQSYYGSLNFTPTSATGTGMAWLSSSQGTHVAGSSSITIANLNWQLGSDPSNPGIEGSPSTFNSQSFGLALSLTDEASHAQGTLHFLGSFSGVVPDSGTLTFTPSIQTLHLGQNLYTVDISHPVDPSNQTFSFNYASSSTWSLAAEFGGGIDISATVNVQPLSVQSAPEPTSLTLACLGLPSLGLARWFRRRRKGVTVNAGIS